MRHNHGGDDYGDIDGDSTRKIGFTRTTEKADNVTSRKKPSGLTERLMFARSGEVYYSPNHYDSFVRIR